MGKIILLIFIVVAGLVCLGMDGQDSNSSDTKKKLDKLWGELKNKKYDHVIKQCKKMAEDASNANSFDDAKKYAPQFQALEQVADFYKKLDCLVSDTKSLYTSPKDKGQNAALTAISNRFDDLTALKKSLYDDLPADIYTEYNKLYLMIMSLKNINDAKQVKQVMTKISPLTKDEQAKLSKATKQKAAKDAEKDFDTRLVNTDVDLKRLADQLAESDATEFSLCLYGAPGTGKSAYAKYLAQRLGMNIIIKRASDLKSKWVGDSEKAIANAFKEAHDQGAMLVFDEADSFLSDRSKADASWEVSQVNEMLTQMETSKIPFVCTTNLLATIDKAALRRFIFKVKYGFMTEPQVKLAYERFFGKPVKKSVKHLTKLSPGDFSVVQKKARVLKITDEAELIEMLEQEMATKDI